MLFLTLVVSETSMTNKLATFIRSTLKITLFTALAVIILTHPGMTKAQDTATTAGESHTMSMFTTVRVLQKGDPLINADIVMYNQSRTTDSAGFATFEDLPHGEYPARVFFNGKTYDITLKSLGGPVTVDIANNGLLSLDTGLMLLAVLIAIALVIALTIYGNSQSKKSLFPRSKNTKTVAFGAMVFVLVLAFILTLATYQKSIVAALFKVNNANQSLY
jgi:hypothetical protein